MTKQLITLTDITKILKISHYKLKDALTLTQGFPSPDAQIGTRYGWTHDRIALFGTQEGLLDNQGNPTDVPRNWHQPVAPKWKTETQQFLGKEGVGAVLGLSPDTIYINYWKGEFIPPDIKIGRMPGWSPETIHRYAEQRG